MFLSRVSSLPQVQLRPPPLLTQPVICRIEHTVAIPNYRPLLEITLKPELLREPNHHERKSNQKEEDARACAVVLRSHCRTAVSLLARPSGPSAWRHLAGDASPDRAELNSAIVRRRTRVVPLRTVNEKLNVGYSRRSWRMRISAKRLPDGGETCLSRSMSSSTSRTTMET